MEVSGPKSAKAPVISRNVLLKLLTSSEDDLRNANPLITEVFDTRVLSPNSLGIRSEEHTSELQSPCNRVCRPLLEKKNTKASTRHYYRGRRACAAPRLHRPRS